MLFNTFTFFAFLIVVLATTWAVPSAKRNYVLLISSYFFYGFADYRFCFLLLGISVSDYLIAKQINKSLSKSKAKKWLLLSIVIDIGILCFFKYFNFFQETIVDLAGLFDFKLEGSWITVVLPIGISFYVFQSISYTVDVYRKRLPPVERFFDYALYVSLFPQLVAGPVERANQLVPQVLKSRKVDPSDLHEGFLLICWGLFKKVYIADNLGIRVDRIFAEPVQSGSAVLVGIICFAFQIYADFSGYTDIARGCARWLGFKLSLNFRQPYFSQNPAEFWQRWHISLSTWLRDYLFLPLGGLSPFPRNVMRATMVTMILAGLWHGAAYNFILWGTYHGILLVGFQIWKRHEPKWLQKKQISKNFAKRYLNSILLFAFLLYGMLLFRASSLGQIVEFTQSLFSFSGNRGDLSILIRSIPYIAPLVVWDLIANNEQDELWILSKPIALQILFYVFCFYGIMILGYTGAQRFIYFDF